MSGPVYIQAASVASLQPEGGTGNRSVGVELWMTDRQVREAVRNLLGGMPEQEVCDWLRSEFPAWFAGVAGGQVGMYEFWTQAATDEVAARPGLQA